jgi:biopolymer transport protein ExbD
MTMKFQTRHKRRAVIDITSLIDLVFLLVAFFMVTSSMGSESSITVHLPRAVQSGEIKPNTMVITVDEENRIYVDDVLFKEENLLDHFTGMKANLKGNYVVIRGDRKADYQTIIRVMDDLNRAGIPQFVLSTTK